MQCISIRTMWRKNVYNFQYKRKSYWNYTYFSNTVQYIHTYIQYDMTWYSKQLICILAHRHRTVSDNSLEKVGDSSFNFVPIDKHLHKEDSKSNDDHIAERILCLLSELQSPNAVDKLPLVDRNLHCKYCRGRLQILW